MYFIGKSFLGFYYIILCVMFCQTSVVNRLYTCVYIHIYICMYSCLTTISERLIRILVSWSTFDFTCNVFRHRLPAHNTSINENTQ